MSLPKNWDLRVDPTVPKTLKRIPPHDSETVFDIIRHLPDDPYFGDIQKMKGENNAWRRRVGVYRIFYRIKVVEKIILVFKVERRSSKTY